MTTHRRRCAAVLTALALLTGSAAAAAPAMAEQAPPNAQASTQSVTDNASLINAWYETYLFRSAYGDPGAQYWVDRLSVQAPADVLWSITHSREYNTLEIENLYDVFFERDLDPGANYWIEGTTAQRFPLEWVEQNILASSEYAKINRGDLVAGWYFSAFGDDSNRSAPSRGEEAYWNGRIRAIGPLGALREFYYAPEIVAQRIIYTYEIELSRDPSGGEINYWFGKEVESDINVKVLIANTPEYRAVNPISYE